MMCSAMFTHQRWICCEYKSKAYKNWI